MYKVTVENAYVERFVIVYAGYSVLCLNTVTALVQVLGILVAAGVVNVPAVLVVKLLLQEASGRR